MITLAFETMLPTYYLARIHGSPEIDTVQLAYIW